MWWRTRSTWRNPANLIIAAVILVSALGFDGLGGLSSSPAITISLSGLAIAAILGITLNAVLPGNDYSFDDESRDDGKTSVSFKV